MECYNNVNRVFHVMCPMMCGYMHGHYHIHLRVRELAVTPSPVNHMALGDHLFLSLILCEPHKAKSFGVSSLGVSFYLEDKQRLLAVSAYNPKQTCILLMFLA